MRIPTYLLLLPLLAVYPARAPLNAQVQFANTGVTAEDSGTVSVRWNRLVPKLVDQNTASRRAARRAATAAHDSATLRRLAMSPPPFLFTVYTLLSVAQYQAVNSARDNRTVSADIAVAAASAAVLTGLYTDSAVRASIAGQLARDINHVAIGSRETELAIPSRRLGEDIGGRVVASAAPLNMMGPWKGTVPTGPGMWYSAKGIPLIGANMTTAPLWLLDSASQFRPAPPPAYGSPVFNAALEEVRRVARQRTAEQTKIAQLWDSSDPWDRWNDVASATIRRHRLSDDAAARVLAVLNAAASDAIIACFEAKYHYWTIRPSQADTTLVLADSVGLPNFPSYPSGHACSAGAFEGTLAYFFPEDHAEFARIAEEQAMSRLYGGIHYRFDNDQGLALGRAVARYDAERDRRGGLSVWRKAR
jgi:membrane-associated phospholipid phosphatase